MKIILALDCYGEKLVKIGDIITSGHPAKKTSESDDGHEEVQI